MYGTGHVYNDSVILRDLNLIELIMSMTMSTLLFIVVGLKPNFHQPASRNKRYNILILIIHCGKNQETISSKLEHFVQYFQV